MKKSLIFAALAAMLMFVACEKPEGGKDEPVTPTNPNVGTAECLETSGRTSCGWVRLWKNGPKFAEFNVGATITDYADPVLASADNASYVANFANSYACTENVGGLYAWANPLHNARKVMWSQMEVTLDPMNDVASTIWGSDWATPNRNQLDALIDGVTSMPGVGSKLGLRWEWCDGKTVQYCEGCPLPGYKVSGAEGTDFENNSIFFPCTGSFNVTNSGNPATAFSHPSDYANYWSANQDENNTSAYLVMSKTRPMFQVYTSGVFFGLAVRPIYIR